MKTLLGFYLQKKERKHKQSKLNLIFLACEKTAYKTLAINLQIKSKNITQDVFKLCRHIIFPFHIHFLLLRKINK